MRLRLLVEMVRVMGMPANFRLLFPRMEFRERPQGWGQAAALGTGLLGPEPRPPAGAASSPSPRGRREPRVPGPAPAAGLRSSPRPQAARARRQLSWPSLTFLLLTAPLAPGTASHTRPIASLRGAQRDVSLGPGAPHFVPPPTPAQGRGGGGAALRSPPRPQGGGRGNQRRRDGVKRGTQKGKPSGSADWLPDKAGAGEELG